MADLLRVDGVSMRFGGVRALDDVSFCVADGEALGLVGPNGAGKTTLFDCICGRIRPSSGSVAFAGVCIDGVPTYRRARMGIGRTFQRLEVFPELTVREHLVVAERAHRGGSALWRDMLNIAGIRPEEDARVDVHGNQVALTQRSRCYQSSQMTCTTCHNVHAPERAPAAYSEKCLQCHKDNDCGEFARLGTKIRENCVDCHMPLQESDLIISNTAEKQVKARMRNHWIKVYPGAQVP